MRVEQAYPGEALRHLRGKHGQPRTCPVVYWTTGETVDPGVYQCTLCGGMLRLRRRVPLPLCAACDGSEFIAASGLAYPALVGGSARLAREPRLWLEGADWADEEAS